MKLTQLAKQVIEEKIQRLNEVDYEEIFSPETMSLLKKQSKDELVKLGKNLRQMMSTASTLLPELIEAEQPHIDLLEEIAKEIVTQAYPIIKYSKIKINAKIGEGKLPQGIPDEEKEEEEKEQPELPQPTLTGEKKRRIINGITQGASIRGTFAFLLFREYLDDLGDDMINRYNELMKSVFGIYDDENAIAQMLALLAQGQKLQGGESEAYYDEGTETLVINATAICFPMLVHEIVKGLYEILSLHGFGSDAEQNKKIVSKVDKLSNEPNDIRFGKIMFDAINKVYIKSEINDTRVRELFFPEMYKIDDETEFVNFVANALENKLTSTQEKWAMDTMRDIERDLKADDAKINKDIPNDEGDEDVFTEIKAQPVNKLIKPTKKKTITDEPYIDIDTSFIEDYILDYGEISDNIIKFFREVFVRGYENTMRDSEYIDYILNGDYKLYFNEDKKEIDYILTLNDPLNIKDYARDRAEMLSDNPEDIDFLTEEIMLAIETIQDNIPKYLAAKNILKDKFTIISNDEFSVILTSDSHSFLYTMIEKQDGYFNKNGEIVIYTT